MIGTIKYLLHQIHYDFNDNDNNITQHEKSQFT